MRQFKFRGWLPKEKVMIPVTRLTMIDDWVGCGNENRSGGIDKHGSAIIEQYTGFKDNKRTKKYPEGQEIYEGDIVDIRYDGGGHTKIMKTPCVCKYGKLDLANYSQTSYPDNYMCFYFEQVGGPNWFALNGNEDKGVKIIGNIHENPELLEKSK